MRLKLWTAGCAAAMLVPQLAAAPARADVKAGVEAWSRGDDRRAIEEWRGPAVNGDPDAQFNLGQAYKLGRGVPVDLPIAEGWYRKAAAQGHIQAEDNFALALFQNGKRAEALPWLEKSAARGEPRAQYVLGTMLFNGDGVKKDWVRAYALTVRASQAGLPQAGQSLAQMDRYIAAADRQRGAELARTMDVDAARPVLPEEVAGGAPPPPPPLRGRPGRDPIRTADLPPSSAEPDLRYPAPGFDDRPLAGDRPGARYPVPGGTADMPRDRLPEAPRGRPATMRPGPVLRPAPALAQPAPARVGPGWRIQLGAFRDRANAEALWERTRGRVGALRTLQPIMVSAGPVTKLQAGPVRTAALATSLCRQVKAAGADCLTVAP